VGEAPDRIVLVQSQEEAEAIQVPDPDKVAVITQTTLAVDDTKDILDTIRRRFPSASLPAREDICYATQNRQMAVKDLSGRADLLLVVGSDNSSNSIRLVEVSRARGTPSYLIDDVSRLKPEWLDGVKVVGITAGASAPEKLVQELVDYFRAMGARRVENDAVVEESVHFELPLELEHALTARNEAP
jgi:4-hydroxy-3-methylbut-2-enyl diphosphate reductase